MSNDWTGGSDQDAALTVDGEVGCTKDCPANNPPGVVGFGRQQRRRWGVQAAKQGRLAVGSHLAAAQLSHQAAKRRWGRPLPESTQQLPGQMGIAMIGERGSTLSLHRAQTVVHKR
jgi:hypothetical protein